MIDCGQIDQNAKKNRSEGISCHHENEGIWSENRSRTIVMFTIIGDQMTFFQGCSSPMMLDIQTLLDLIWFPQRLTRRKKMEEENEQRKHVMLSEAITHQLHADECVSLLRSSHQVDK